MRGLLESGSKGGGFEIFDTVNVCHQAAMRQIVRLGRWEERNNDDKEERLEFGTREGEKIRILGSWVGNERDC